MIDILKYKAEKEAEAERDHRRSVAAEVAAFGFVGRALSAVEDGQQTPGWSYAGGLPGDHLGPEDICGNKRYDARTGQSYFVSPRICRRGILS